MNISQKQVAFGPNLALCVFFAFRLGPVLDSFLRALTLSVRALVLSRVGLVDLSDLMDLCDPLYKLEAYIL